MDQDGDPPPTTWFQPPITTSHDHRHHHRRPPINTVVLILLLSILLLLLFFFLPTILSHIQKTIKSTSLKFTWDLLNGFLVFFAILCGVFAPKNNNVYAANPENNLPPEDYEYREKLQVDGESRNLRQEFALGEYENRFRFSDDFGMDLQYSSPVNNRLGRSEVGKWDIYGSETVSGDIRHRPPGSEEEEVTPRVEGKGSMVEPPNVPESMVEPPVPSTAPTPPLSVKLRRRQTSRSLGQDEAIGVTNRRIDEVHEVSDTPPPPSPPQPAKSEHRLHMKYNRLERKLREATTEMETTMSSMDDHKKRKRKNKQKSRNIQPLIPSIQPPPPPAAPPSTFKEEINGNEILSANAAQPPSPPPSQSQPRSIFFNLFKSSGKIKRFHFSKTSPPRTPPPPPSGTPPSSIINIFTKTVTKSTRLNSSSSSTPPRPITNVQSKQESKRKSHIQPPSQPSATKPETLRQHHTSKDKPPLPTKAINNHGRAEFLTTRSSSLLNPVPPHPPFKMTTTTTCERREAVDLPPTIKDDGDSFGPRPISFPSPSPDVNAKAESFISRCRTEWRMDKMNSLKNKVSPR